MRGIHCKALWIKALYKCSPFTIYQKRDVAHNLEDNWRQKLAEKNDWYKWMAYTGMQHGWTDCYTCSRANPDKLYIVNTPFNWTTCNCKGHVPWCPAECLIFLWSSTYGAYLTFYDMNINKLKNLPVNFTNHNRCRMLDIRIKSNVPPPTSTIVTIGKMECFEKRESVVKKNKQEVIPLGLLPLDNCVYGIPLTHVALFHFPMAETQMAFHLVHIFSRTSQWLINTVGVADNISTPLCLKDGPVDVPGSKQFSVDTDGQLTQRPPPNHSQQKGNISIN